jgi:RimJ/RimL family protein N-acetyltransferase
MLIGKTVCLGPILQADGPYIFNWLNTLGLAYLNGSYRPTDQMKFEGWFSSIGNDPSKVIFSIRRHADMRLLGYLQIVNIHPVIHAAEVGILIGDDTERGKGHGQEALRMALGFCWRDLNLQRLSLFVFGENERAIHVYRKVGFKHEGTMRRGGYVGGRLVDVTVMGALRPDDADGRVDADETGPGSATDSLPLAQA